jgi:Ca2+-binding RTX toxin-like protein
MVLTESTGSATINFGSGNATVTGGSGSQIYVFSEHSSGGRDQINNFKVGTDTMQFTGGNSIASQAIVGGSTYLTLADNTQVVLLHVATTLMNG